MEKKVSLVKRGWKPCTNPKVCKIFKEVVAECRKKFPHSNISGLDETLYVRSYAHSYGKCAYGIVCGKVLSAIVVDKGLIAMKNERDIRNTIIHEVAHAAAPLRAHHNSEWKHIGDTIGKKWGMSVQRVGEKKALQRPPLYILQCCKCGAKWNCYRASKFVQNFEHYHCGCSGRIKLIYAHGKEVK